MARIRSVRPEFCTSYAIAELSLTTQLHFVRLWTHCDDEGRAVDDPRLLKGACWPLEDSVSIEDIKTMQDELVNAGRIVRYRVAGRPYFEVANWHEHQKPNRPVPSKLPKRDPLDCSANEESVSTHVQSSEDSVSAHGGLTSVVGDVEGDGGGEVEVGVVAPPDLFETCFWPSYPRKAGKPKALIAWKAATKKTDPDTILAGLDAWLPYWAAKDEPEFVPHPTTWLNQERWADTPPQAKAPKQGRRDTFTAGLAGLAEQIITHPRLELASGDR